MEHGNTFTTFSPGDGGVLRRALRAVGVGRRGATRAFEAVVLGALAWLPLAVLAMAQAATGDRASAGAFLMNFAVHARFLIAIPVLVIAEDFIAPRLAAASAHFIRSGLVGDQERAAFRSAVDEGRRLINWMGVDMVILGLVYVNVLAGGGAEGAEELGIWRRSAGRATPAQIWYLGVSLPLFQFLLVRWIWRIGIWCRFLWRMSRLRLPVLASHPDLAGGLAFLGTAQAAFSPVACAAAIVISAGAGERIVFGGQPLASLQGTLLGFVGLCLVLLFAPLALFSPMLLAAKRRDLLEYDTLATRYVRAFDDRWVQGRGGEGEPLLGSADFGSLADLGSSVEVVRRTRWLPCGWRAFLEVSAAAVVPMFPLLLSVVPLREILTRVAGVLL
jgi:hypothetical protein